MWPSNSISILSSHAHVNLPFFLQITCTSIASARASSSSYLSPPVAKNRLVVFLASKITIDGAGMFVISDADSATIPVFNSIPH